MQGIAQMKEALRFSTSGMRMALQASFAAVATYLVTAHFGLPQSYWAVMAAILIVQTNVGASLRAAIDRVLATVLGAAIGAGFVGVFGTAAASTAAGLAISVFTLAFVAASYPSLRLAPVTAAMVILAVVQFASPFEAALNRTIEIAIGAVIAVITSLVVFPSRASTTFPAHIAKMLPLYAQYLNQAIETALGGDGESDGGRAIADKIRASLYAGDGLAAEIRHENTGRLVERADPAPLLRALRRLWHTEVMVARAARVALTDDVTLFMRPALENVRDASNTRIHDLATSFETNRPSPSDERVGAALETMESAIAAGRRSGATRALSNKELGRLFTLMFAFTQLEENLNEIGERFCELRGNGVPAKAPAGL